MLPLITRPEPPMPSFSLLSVYKHDPEGLHCSWLQDCCGTAELAHLRARATEAANGGATNGFTVVVVNRLEGVSTLDPLVLVRPDDVLVCPERQYVVMTRAGHAMGFGDTARAAWDAARQESWHTNRGALVEADYECKRAPSLHGFVPCVAGRSVAVQIVRIVL